jgi:hypothetical protein
MDLLVKNKSEGGQLMVSPKKCPPKNSLTRYSGYSKRNYPSGRKGLMSRKQLTFWGWWWWNERGGEVCP